MKLEGSPGSAAGLSWTTIDGFRIPCFLRNGGQFVPVRLVETVLLNRYPNSDELGERPLVGHRMTEAEVEVMNGDVTAALFPVDHVVGAKSEYSSADVVVRLEDFMSFYGKAKERFRGIVHPESVIGGWIQMNNIVLPYVVRQGSKIVPLEIIKMGARLLTDLDTGEFELDPVASEWIYLNNSIRDGGFDYQLQPSAKLIDLAAVWLLSPMALSIKELPGKDPIREASYEDDQPPSDTLSLDEVKPILIKPAEQPDDVICLVDEDCSSEKQTATESHRDWAEASMAVSEESFACDANEELGAIYDSVVSHSAGQELQKSASKSKRKRNSSQRNFDKSLRRLLLEEETTTNISSTSESQSSNSTPYASNAHHLNTSPCHGSNFSTPLTFPLSHFDGHSVDQLNRNSGGGLPLGTCSQLDGQPSLRYEGAHQISVAYTQVSNEMQIGGPPPLLTGRTNSDHRNIDRRNLALCSSYQTANHVRNHLTSSRDVEVSAIGSSILSPRRTVPTETVPDRSRRTSEIGGMLESYGSEIGAFCQQNRMIPPLNVDRIIPNQEMIPPLNVDRMNAPLNDGIIRSPNASRIIPPNYNNRTIPHVNSDGMLRPPKNFNETIQPHSNGRFMPYPKIGESHSLYSNSKGSMYNGTMYNGTATGVIHGNPHVPAVPNRGARVSNRLTIPGVTEAMSDNRVFDTYSGVISSSHSCHPYVQSTPMNLPSNRSNRDILRGQLSASRISSSGSTATKARASQQTQQAGNQPGIGVQLPTYPQNVKSTIQQQRQYQQQLYQQQRYRQQQQQYRQYKQQQQQQQQVAREQYYNSLCVSETSRILKMHQSVSADGQSPPVENASPVRPVAQDQSRRFDYGFTKPWEMKAKLTSSDVIAVVHFLGKRITCLVKRDAVYAPLETLHAQFFADSYSLDDWLYMIYMNSASATILLTDEEKKFLELFGIQSKEIRCRRAISLEEFYKHLPDYGLAPL